MPQLTIKNVSADLHKAVKVQAAKDGMSILDWCLRAIRIALKKEQTP